MVKRRGIGLIAGILIASTGWAAPSSPSMIATPPQPKWSELNIKQKIVLAPLSDDWDSLEFFRQKKWLGIAERFPQMAPDEQRRIQVQMQEWSKLTPEQRQLARETFKSTNRLPADKKQELKQKWEEYSSLPEEEKKKLQQQAESQSVAKVKPVSPTPSQLPPVLPPPPAPVLATPVPALAAPAPAPALPAPAAAAPSQAATEAPAMLLSPHDASLKP